MVKIISCTLEKEIVYCTSITPYGSFKYEIAFDEHDNVCDQIDAEIKGLTNFNRLEK